MAANYRDLERQLPYVLRDKLRYYLDFVNDRLFEVAYLEDLSEQIPEVRREVELIFLLRLLYGYFVVGYRNFTAALEYFESMNVDGFQIGTTEFTSNSPVTNQWRELSDDLQTLLMTSNVAEYMRSNLATDEIIRRILRSRVSDQDETIDE